MSDGFTLWFTGLSGAGKTTIAEIVGRLSSSVAAGSSSISTATPSANTSRKGFSKEQGPRHEHRAGRVGRIPPRPSRGGCHRLGDLPYEETRRKARDMTEEFGPSSRCTSTLRSRPAPSATSRACTRKPSPARSRSSRASPTPTRPRRAPSCGVDTETHTPEESSQLILGKLAELGLVEDEVPA